jgi:hypothetical protein
VRWEVWTAVKKGRFRRISLWFLVRVPFMSWSSGSTCSAEEGRWGREGKQMKGVMVVMKVKVVERERDMELREAGM